jgi:hypothetical protein
MAVPSALLRSGNCNFFQRYTSLSTHAMQPSAIFERLINLKIISCWALIRGHFVASLFFRTRRRKQSYLAWEEEIATEYCELAMIQNYNLWVLKSTVQYRLVQTIVPFLTDWEGFFYSGSQYVLRRHKCSQATP